MVPIEKLLYGWSGGGVEFEKQAELMEGGDSVVSSGASTKAAACKSHKEAERRRRQRINAHLSTLRTLLPCTTKTDKASLLAEVVNHLKELRKQAAEVALRDRELTSAGAEPEPWPLPTESDEVTLSCCDGDSAGCVKATLCCEDRPGLNSELMRAIRSVRARPVRAEMSTVGGRTKNVVVLEWADGCGPCGEDEFRTLKRALKAVVENRASTYGPRQMISGNKRARVYGSFYDGEDDELI